MFCSSDPHAHIKQNFTNNIISNFQLPGNSVLFHASFILFIFFPFYSKLTQKSNKINVYNHQLKFIDVQY